MSAIFGASVENASKIVEYNQLVNTWTRTISWDVTPYRLAEI
jgi:hypothetical protein